MPPGQVSSTRHQEFQKLRDTEGSKPLQDYLGELKASHKLQNLQFHKPAAEHKTQLSRKILRVGFKQELCVFKREMLPLGCNS